MGMQLGILWVDIDNNQRSDLDCLEIENQNFRFEDSPPSTNPQKNFLACGEICPVFARAEVSSTIKHYSPSIQHFLIFSLKAVYRSIWRGRIGFHVSPPSQIQTHIRLNWIKGIQFYNESTVTIFIRILLLVLFTVYNLFSFLGIKYTSAHTECT